jgi:hypothetical protein
VEFDPRHSLVYHWWDRTKSGKLKIEGWPGYSLETGDDVTTIVRHHAEMHTHGIYRLATPIFRKIALKERAATVDALKAYVRIEDVTTPRQTGPLSTLLHPRREWR